jgi:hypothetical protein
MLCNYQLLIGLDRPEGWATPGIESAFEGRLSIGLRRQRHSQPGQALADTLPNSRAVAPDASGKDEGIKSTKFSGCGCGLSDNRPTE